MKATKEQILVAIRKGKGIVTSVCQQLSISRQAFYLRANKDEEIFEALQEAREEIIDFAETKLIQLIGDTLELAVISFYQIINCVLAIFSNLVGLCNFQYE